MHHQQLGFWDQQGRKLPRCSTIYYGLYQNRLSHAQWISGNGRPRHDGNALPAAGNAKGSLRHPPAKVECHHPWLTRNRCYYKKLDLHGNIMARRRFLPYINPVKLNHGENWKPVELMVKIQGTQAPWRRGQLGQWYVMVPTGLFPSDLCLSWVMQCIRSATHDIYIVYI